MHRHISAIVALVAMASSSVVAAQTFTYTSTSGAPTVAVGGIAPDGRPFGAQSVSGTSQSVMDGKTTPATFKCISMTQPANDQIFNAHMMCDVAASDGNFTSAWGCNMVGKDEQACVGRLLGQTGAYANRSGSVTGHTKAGVSVGTGQWLK